ncbi:MAG: hypothetical protein PHH77_04225, partial [Victivallaceae bacterium]|nr:hypothetical protein [Victivallaceae bacterium]
ARATKLSTKYPKTVFRTPNDMILAFVNRMRYISKIFHFEYLCGKVFPRHKTAHFVRCLYAPKLDSSIKSEDQHCFQKQKNCFFVFELFISSFAGASSQVKKPIRARRAGAQLRYAAFLT